MSIPIKSFTVAVSGLLLSSVAIAATLELPEGFYATAVNGESIKATADKINIDTGDQVVTVIYEEVFGQSNETGQHIVSEPIYVIFDADADATYRISADLPDSAREAQKFIHSPQLQLSTAGHSVAVDVDVGQIGVSQALSDK